MFENKHRGWEQKQDGCRSKAPQDGRHSEGGHTQPIDRIRDQKEGLTGTDTDEHWGFEVTKTGEYKIQDIHGGEISGGST